MARFTIRNSIRNGGLALIWPRRPKFLLLFVVGLLFIGIILTRLSPHRSKTADKALRFDPQPKVDPGVLKGQGHHGNVKGEHMDLLHKDNQLPHGEVEKVVKRNDVEEANKDTGDVINIDAGNEVKRESTEKQENRENNVAEKLQVGGEKHQQIPVPVDQDKILKNYGQSLMENASLAQEGDVENNNMGEGERNNVGNKKDAQANQIPLPVDQVKARFHDKYNSNTAMKNEKDPVQEVDGAMGNALRNDQGNGQHNFGQQQQSGQGNMQQKDRQQQQNGRGNVQQKAGQQQLNGQENVQQKDGQQQLNGQGNVQQKYGQQQQNGQENMQQKPGQQQQIPLPRGADKAKLYKNYGKNSGNGSNIKVEPFSREPKEEGGLVDVGLNVGDAPKQTLQNTVMEDRLFLTKSVNLTANGNQVQAQKEVQGSNQIDSNRNQVQNQQKDESVPAELPKNVWIPEKYAVQDARIVNPHNFNYIINNETLCQTPTGYLEYVVYIHMAPFNIARRQRLRETWAQANLFKDYPSRLVFFMGDPQNSTIQSIIASESKQYGDIIQEDFKDHYNNLTYKAIGALKWISVYCRNANYVVKGDDDVYVNMFLLLDDLHDNLYNSSNTMYCAVWQPGTMAILRDPKVCKKWCISLDHKELQGKRTYPTYCSGSAYFFTTDLAHKLYNASLYTPYFYIDDVFVTGLLPQKIPGFRFIDANPDRWVLWGEHIRTLFKDPKAQKSVMVTHDQDIRIMWYDHLQRLNATQVDQIGQGKLNHILSQNPFNHQDKI